MEFLLREALKILNYLPVELVCLIGEYLGAAYKQEVLEKIRAMVPKIKVSTVLNISIIRIGEIIMTYSICGRCRELRSRKYSGAKMWVTGNPCETWHSYVSDINGAENYETCSISGGRVRIKPRGEN
nr:hypothetical protein K-LCC10_0322 [Kaumoebavirus]